MIARTIGSPAQVRLVRKNTDSPTPPESLSHKMVRPFSPKSLPGRKLWKNDKTKEVFDEQ